MTLSFTTAPLDVTLSALMPVSWHLSACWMTCRISNVRED